MGLFVSSDEHGEAYRGEADIRHPEFDNWSEVQEDGAIRSVGRVAMPPSVVRFSPMVRRSTQPRTIIIVARTILAGASAKRRDHEIGYDCFPRSRLGLGPLDEAEIATQYPGMLVSAENGTVGKFTGLVG